MSVAPQRPSYGTHLLNNDSLDDELAEVPFEALGKLQERSGVYPKPRGKTPTPVVKRQSKHHPVELSSKKPVSLFKDVSVDGNQRRTRDPRFTSRCGKWNPHKFRSDFAFLYDEQLPAEAAALKQRLKSVTESEERSEIKAELTHVNQQIHDEKERRRRQSTTRQIHETEMKAVQGGKRPFYLKRRELKRRHLVAQYNSLKEEGRLEHFLHKKKRKRHTQD